MVENVYLFADHLNIILKGHTHTHTDLLHFLQGNTPSGSPGGFGGALLFFPADSGRGFRRAEGGVGW